MPNALLKFKEPAFVLKRAHYAARYVWRSISGIAHDFWKDGGQPLRDDDLEDKAPVKPAEEATPAPPKMAMRLVSPTSDLKQSYLVGPDGLWHALPGEISERMWGIDYVTPGDEYFTDRLIRPLGVNKDMSILDLSAGLGGRLRKTTDEYGVYINGLEPDAEVAKRGMEKSVIAGRGKRATIAHYDPMNLKVARSYDCIIARETLYRVADKEKFIKLIVGCCKPKAQVSFTDYILNAEARDAPAVVKWREMEPGADPAGLVEMAELWSKAGINLRVHDDLTDHYKKEVMIGLTRFTKFMQSGVKPDAETKKAIDKRITTWANRMAAMEAGLKFYRFYGLR